MIQSKCVEDALSEKIVRDALQTTYDELLKETEN